ncbi:unnamed protein product [Soboliphyme baturini]|uniref:Retinol dehydrogenase 14 n=1 Tax=Soboliphyme baturini TaxID=241478 RepID=A0A183INE1_9BILA|nr:unnamed protein product [Soboliphyme baturini]
MCAVKRTILVTGSTDGIGKETALQLARSAENLVIVHGRNVQRCTDSVEMIKRKTGNENVHFIVADFSLMSNVSRMAETLKTRFPALNVVLCNAGVLLPKREISLDKLELTFQVNYLAHFALVNLLLELLKNNRPSRIVMVSSICHSWHSIDWDDLFASKNYEKYEQYSRTKLELHMLALTLARRLRDSGVTCNVCEPGVVETKLLRAGGYHGEPVENGARVAVHLCQSDMHGVNGTYFDHNLKIEESFPDSKVEQLQEKLWNLSMDIWTKCLKNKNDDQQDSNISR